MSYLRTISYDLDVMPYHLVVSIPHSGRFYPNDIQNNLKIPLESLRIFEDPYLDLLFPPMVPLASKVIINHCARAYIDVNRDYKNNKNVYNMAESSGLIPIYYPNGKNIYKHELCETQKINRLDSIYFPFHELLSKTLYDYSQNKLTLLLDIHSMPPKGGASDVDALMERPDIVLGNNHGKSCPHFIIETLKILLEKENFSVKKNFPFSGGFITQNYGLITDRIYSLQIEINRSLYIDNQLMINKNKAQKVFHALKKVFQNFMAFSLDDSRQALLKPIK